MGLTASLGQQQNFSYPSSQGSAFCPLMVTYYCTTVCQALPLAQQIVEDRHCPCPQGAHIPIGQ